MDFPFTGVIPVDKPVGVTSRRVVDAVARAAAMRTVGHAGTLDPLAAGVVVVCLGHATRLVDFLHAQSKSYAATFLLGRSSPSDDLETPVEEEPAPRVPTSAEIETAAATLRGDILQRPCDYSAVHVDGKRAYRLARKGRAPVIAARPVHVARLEVTAWEWPRLALDIECSSGTFVRALGRDLAIAVGTRAVMASLARTRVGPFGLADAVSLESLTPDAVARFVRPPLDALPHLPRVVLAGPLLDRAVRGGLLADADLPAIASAPGGAVIAPVPGDPQRTIVALDDDGVLIGILGRLDQGAWRLRPNFRGIG